MIQVFDLKQTYRCCETYFYIIVFTRFNSDDKKRNYLKGSNIANQTKFNKTKYLPTGETKKNIKKIYNIN